MNTCEKLSALFSDYIDEELSSGKVKELDAHLAECADCRNTVTRLKTLRDQLKQLTRMQTASDFETVLHTRVTLDRHPLRSTLLSNPLGGAGRIVGFSTVGLIICVMAVSYLFWQDQSEIEASPYKISAFKAPDSHRVHPNQQLDHGNAEVYYILDTIPPRPIPNPRELQADHMRLEVQASSDSSLAPRLVPLPNRQNTVRTVSF